MSTTYGGHHVLVPFVMEAGGRLGAHGHAFLMELARKAMKAGMHNRTFWLDSAGCLAKGEIAFRVALWVQR